MILMLIHMYYGAKISMRCNFIELNEIRNLI